MGTVIRAAILVLVCALPGCTTTLSHNAATPNAWVNTSGDGGGGGGGGGGGNGM